MLPTRSSLSRLLARCILKERDGILVRKRIFSLHTLIYAETMRKSVLAHIYSHLNLPRSQSTRKSTPFKFFSTSVTISDETLKRKMEEISVHFQETMELLDDARDSVGTVYFTEDMSDAEKSIYEVLTKYETLLEILNSDQKRDVIRTIGLKIEELKSQAEMIKETTKE